MSNTRSSVLHFGVFEADLATGELRKNGRTVKLQPQPFKVLALLLERSGQLVTREEIRDKLWGGQTFVDFEQGLNFAVNKLRQALGDDADRPRYIETLPRRGYRFIATLEPVGAVPIPLGQSLPHAATPQNRVVSISGGLKVSLEASPPDSVHSVASAGSRSASVDITTVPGPRGTRVPLPVATKHGAPLPWPLILIGALLVLASGLAVAWFERVRPVTPPQIAEHQITANPPEDYIRAAAMSPDGKYVAYHDLTGLYLRSVDSGETRSVRLQEGFSNALAELRWFPDGGKLLAVVNNPQPYGLWVIPILGEAQPQLVYRNGVLPAISPDGQSLAFMSCCKDRSFQEILVGGISGETPRKLVTVHDQGTAAAQLENASVWYPAWSPDGRWIAYVRRWKSGQATQASAIEVRPAAGGSARTLVCESSLPKGSSVCDFIGNGPCMVWSPDGRLVFTASQTAESPFAQPKYSLWQISVEPSTGEAAGRPGPLTPWNDFDPADLSIAQDGRRLSLLKWRAWSDVYLAGLGPGGTSLKPPRRFTLDNRGISGLDAWTSDSQSILFSSAQNGRSEILRQRLNENVAEAIVRGPEGYRCPRLTADGSWMLYVEWIPTTPGAAPFPDRLMRRPAVGGLPEMVLQEPGGDAEGVYVWDYKCPLKAGSPCVLGEKNGKDIDFYSLDPVRGKGKDLGKAGFERFTDWDVSPDGSSLALIGRAGHYGPIEVLSFSNAEWHEISPEPPLGLPGSIAWAADGKGFFVRSWNNDSINVLYVTLAGKAEPLMHNGYRQLIGTLLPSPDGKYLAYQGETTDSNVWMIESF